MRILVCFKVTPDFEALREGDWIAAEGDLEADAGVQTRYVPRVLNCFDESALELALRLREALSERVPHLALDALSVAGKEADPFLTTLLALGYRRAVRVEPPVELDFAPATVSAVITAYVRQRPADLLLLGCRSGPGDGGTVPSRIAEALEWPCLAQVTELGPTADGLRVACVAGEAIVRLTVCPPCVLAVGNAVISRLRVPTLRDRLATRDAPIEVLSPGDLGVDIEAALGREGARLLSLEAISRRRAGRIVAGDSPRAAARRLFDEYLENLLEGL